MRNSVLLGAMVIMMLALSACNTGTVYTNNPSSNNPSSGGSSSSSTQSSVTEPKWGVQTKTSGCQVNGPLQDPACTPGDIIANATTTQICTSGYASTVRNVPQSEKNKAYAEYGITSHLSGQYEVDHLVSLELGGSNDISNLWPEIDKPVPGFHQKDRVENYLHDQVCKGAISLKQAQIEIATNWLDVFNRMPGSSKNG